MRLEFDVRHTLAPRRGTAGTGRVYGQFGLEPEQGERVYVEPFAIEAGPGQIVAFVGTSGSGKTSCLRQFAAQTGAADLAALPVDQGAPLIDQLGSWDRAVAIAARCGLAEAQLLCRLPDELSDGQRYRFALARAVAGGTKTLICDEFLATLDRTTAKVVAYNLRRVVTEEGLLVGVATTHEDILADLAPDHLVRFDGTRAVVDRGEGRPKAFHSGPTWPLPEARAPTGRASLAGITAATR